MQPLAAGFDRRQFLVTKLSAGFALAVLPVSAQTITTDTNGLEAGEVSIPTADGNIPAYRAMPKSGTAFPIVLVVQEIFDAGDGFNADYRPSYNKAAAEDGWKRLQACFKKYGAA